jgi:hypothetical protein
VTGNSAGADGSGGYERTAARHPLVSSMMCFEHQVTHGLDAERARRGGV